MRPSLLLCCVALVYIPFQRTFAQSLPSSTSVGVRFILASLGKPLAVQVEDR